jgi:hypothetical protein
VGAAAAGAATNAALDIIAIASSAPPDVFVTVSRSVAPRPFEPRTA